MYELSSASLSEDAPCLGVLEENQQTGIDTLLGGGWHRVQQIMMMKGDNPVVYDRDLGPSDAFVVSEFHIPGGSLHMKNGDIVVIPRNLLEIDPNTISKVFIQHSLGELMEICDFHRAGGMVAPDYEPQPLWTDWLLEKEQQSIYKKQNMRTVGNIVDDILYKRHNQ